MRISDLDEVVEIERDAFRFALSREILLEELGREWARIDVVEVPSSGQVVAFVNYWIVRDEVHVLNVATKKEERQKGYARSLLEHVVMSARDRGMKEITLEVRRSNAPAQALYAGLGFTPIGVRSKYYADNDEDAIVMGLRLD